MDSKLHFPSSIFFITTIDIYDYFGWICTHTSFEKSILLIQATLVSLDQLVSSAHQNHTLKIPEYDKSWYFKVLQNHKK